MNKTVPISPLIDPPLPPNSADHPYPSRFQYQQELQKRKSLSCKKQSPSNSFSENHTSHNKPVILNTIPLSPNNKSMATTVTFHTNTDNTIGLELATMKNNENEIKTQPTSNGSNNNNNNHSLPRRTSAIQCCYSSIRSSDIMMGWKDLSILSSSPPAKIVAGSSAFVRKGKTLAILGPSGCGKTALMKTLCGREPDLSVSGQIYLDGKTVNLHERQPIAFVPQEDLLIGELTVRETLTISARLRRSDPLEVIDKDVQNLIDALGLKKVGDNAIGTVLKRGLSGGEKRRVAVGVELIAGAKVIFLDEPTSGLDAWTAFQVIKTIRDICHSSNDNISIVCALHQPNSRILELFDDLMLMDRGRTVYFGDVKDSLAYFSSLGFRCPSSSTPTDYFIHVVDKRFAFLNESEAMQSPEEQEHVGPEENLSMDLESEKERLINDNNYPQKKKSKSSHDIDFVSHYRLSPLHTSVHRILDEIGKYAHETMLSELGVDKSGASKGAFWRQFKVLAYRHAVVAVRDITLYWLQFVMTCMFGFMVGVFFWNLPTDINKRMNDIGNGIVWISFVGTYIHSFGVYHQMEMKKRYHHERANGSVTTTSWTLADLLVNLPAAYIAFVPGLLIAFFMMRLPNDSVPFFLFVLGFMTWTAHAMVGFLGQLVKSTPSASLLAQGTFVMFSLFAGGSFVRWSKLGFWIWTSVISVYTWSTRAMMASVYSHLTYNCVHNPSEGIFLSNNICQYNGVNYPCLSGTVTTANTCLIDGRVVLDLSKGVADDENKWFGAGLVVVLFVAYRILVYLFLKFPVHVYLPRVFYYFSNQKLASSLIRAEDDVEVVAARLRMVESTVKELQRVVRLHHRTDISSTSLEDNNGLQPIAETEAEPIAPADSVAIMVRQSSFVPTTAALKWENLTLTLKGKGTKLVSDVNGFAVGGRILAVMGPSGAGKTTLLNALSGRAPYAEIHGNVTLGSRKLRQDDLTYVPQFDSLNPVLSVYDTFITQAKLMNVQTDGDSVRKSVAELINVLGLSEKFNKSVGSLTSGERKRISIGLGLIAHPNILFLDEPTTGLDSEAALAVVEYMFRIVRRTGVICLVTLHQPSSQIWSRLDDLLLMSAGKAAYFGTAHDAEGYFASVGFNVPPNTNPSDYYLDCINRSPAVTLDADFKAANNNNNNNTNNNDSKASGNSNKPFLPAGVIVEESTSWNDLYAKHCAKPDMSTLSKENPPDIERPSEWSRLSTLIIAHLSYYSKETGIYPFRFLEMLLLAIFIGTVFLRRELEMESMNELSGALFFSVWSTLFASISATPTFVRDHLTMENEYLNGCYQLHTHQVASWLASLPYHAITAIVYQLLLHFLVGFHDNFESWVFATLTTMTLLSLMEGISLSIVEAFRDANLATTFCMNILGMFFLFPGFFVKEDDMPRSVFWLSYLVPTRYALNSQLDMIFRGQQYYTKDPSNPYFSGEYILDKFWKIDVENYKKWGDWGIVVLFLFGFRVIHYILTRFNYRKYAR